jgi:hypothetical protein
MKSGACTITWNPFHIFSGHSHPPRPPVTRDANDGRNVGRKVSSKFDPGKIRRRFFGHFSVRIFQREPKPAVTRPVRSEEIRLVGTSNMWHHVMCPFSITSKKICKVGK